MTASHGAITTASDHFERVVLRFLIAARGYASLTVVADTLVGERRFKRPTAARAGAAMIALHGVWAARRGLSRGRVDDRLVGTTDLVVTTLLLVGDAIARGDRYRQPGPQPATDYVGVASGLAAVQFGGGTEFRVAVGGLLAALVGTTTGVGIDGRSAGLTQLFADVLLACEGAATLPMVRRLRELAEELDATRSLAEREIAQLGVERERRHQFRLLHDSAMQLLETIAGGWDVDDAALETRLAFETDRFRTLAESAGASPAEYVGDSLARLADEFALRGFRVTVSDGLDGTRCLTLVETALVGASREALANVAKHAGVAAAHVTARNVGEGIEVLVEDHGRGFDPIRSNQGFGLANSIRARIEDVGGRVELRSTTEGTCVVMWVPS